MSYLRWKWRWMYVWCYPQSAPDLHYHTRLLSSINTWLVWCYSCLSPCLWNNTVMYLSYPHCDWLEVVLNGTLSLSLHVYSMRAAHGLFQCPLFSLCCDDINTGERRVYSGSGPAQPCYLGNELHKQHLAFVPKRLQWCLCREYWSTQWRVNHWINGVWAWRLEGRLTAWMNGWLDNGWMNGWIMDWFMDGLTDAWGDSIVRSVQTWTCVCEIVSCLSCTTIQHTLRFTVGLS